MSTTTERGPAPSRSRRPVAVSLALGCLGTLLLGSAVLMLPAVSRAPWAATVGEAVQMAIYLLAAVLVGVRAALDRRSRVAWSMLALGLLSYGSGNVYYFAVLARSAPEQFPSWADVQWLAFYPLAYACLLLLLRAQVRRWHRSIWLDGLLTTTGLGAVAVALVFGTVLVPGKGSPAEVAVALAYPVADLLLLVLVAGATAVMGWHMSRQWLLLCAGLLAFTVGDLHYLLRSAGDGYVAGTWLDLTWLVGVTAMAAAAWARTQRSAEVGARAWLLLAIPSGFALSSLALLVWGALSLGARNPLATWLSCTTILLALLRAALTFREVQHLSEARHQARTDELTGLPNRRQMLEALARACAPTAPPSAVLLLDLDRFKEVNDSFGHHVGDRLLELVASRLQGCLDRTGLLARMGGDEFAVLLPGADRTEAVHTAHEMTQAVRDAFQLDGMQVHIDISIGIALSSPSGDVPVELLRKADASMYEAKRGRLGYVVWQTGTSVEARHRLQTSEELRHALDADQLVVHYQPKLDLASGAVVGAEALVRWEHPQRGLLYPDAFLPFAEQTGLMRRLTLVVLEKALREVRAWRSTDAGLHVAVNLSVSNLQDAALPEQVALLLAHLDVPADALVLEVTENVLMADAPRAQQVLQGLRALGVRLAVDDFGTGYSSLAYLRALPVDELKLDRSFVSHLRSDPRSAAIVRSTVQLAHELGMVMTAEGVEDADVLGDLTDWHCDLAQGYHIARPMDERRFSDWMAARSVARAPLPALRLRPDLPRGGSEARAGV